MIYSYSSIATFKQCPAKFKFSYIDRVPVDKGPPSPAMERGTKIHESVDAFFNRSNEYLHPDIHSGYGQFMYGLREEYEDIRPEYKWAIDWEFNACEYDAPQAMIHGFIDLLILPAEGETFYQYEWKTGGMYLEQHLEQGFTYAVAMMSHFPQYDEVESMITYFDKKDYNKTVYPRTMMFEYKPQLRRTVGQVADAVDFPPMPSFKCKWCPFSRVHNSGVCSVG